MKQFSVSLILTACRFVRVALWLSGLPAAFAADPAPPTPLAAFDYAKPKLFTATLYEIGSDRKKALYTFRRTATRSNSIVNVERQFFGTNGSLVALEKRSSINPTGSFPFRCRNSRPGSPAPSGLSPTRKTRPGKNSSSVTGPA